MNRIPVVPILDKYQLGVPPFESFSTPKKSNNMFGGILQGVGSLVSGFASIGAGKRQRKAFQLQHDLNQQAYERQLTDQRQLIDEEREYNDFSSVVARARKAGISPGAVIGSANGGNISTSTPTFETPDVQTLESPLSSVGASLSSIGSVLGQSALLKEQIEGQKLANESQSIQNSKDRQDLDDYGRQIEHRKAMDKIEESLGNLNLQINNLEFDIKSSTKDAVISNLKYVAEASKTNSDLLKEDLAQKKIDTKFYQEQKLKELQILTKTVEKMDSDMKYRALEYALNKVKFDFEKEHIIRRYNLDLKKLSVDYYLDSQNKRIDIAKFNAEMKKWALELPEGLFDQVVEGFRQSLESIYNGLTTGRWQSFKEATVSDSSLAPSEYGSYNPYSSVESWK